MSESQATLVEPKPQTTTEPKSKPSAPPTILVSRHAAGLSLSLSRYKRQWFITYPRAYGMVAFPGQRIYCKLNTPDLTVHDEAYVRTHFWLNADMISMPYNPSDPEEKEKRYVSSPIHILLDSDTPVARLTGRTRVEKSNWWEHKKEGKEITVHEVEVFMPDEGLLRQCYYCYGWEYQGDTHRLEAFGDDLYWCDECKKKNTIGLAAGSLWQRVFRDTIIPTLDKNVFPRDSLYYS